MVSIYNVYVGVVLVFAILGLVFFAWMVYFITRDFYLWLKSRKSQ